MAQDTSCDALHVLASHLISRCGESSANCVLPEVIHRLGFNGGMRSC